MEPDDQSGVGGPGGSEAAQMDHLTGGSAIKRLAPLAGLAVVVAVVLIRRRARQGARQLAWLTANLPHR
jgi:hypothetical protein